MNALISVADLLEHGAARWPQHPAYADGGGTMTTNSLRARSAAPRRARRRGVQPGERVAIYAPKRIETVVAMLAANALGAIFVPVNPQLKEAQIEHIVTDSGAALFMTGAQRLKRLPALAALVGERAMLIVELADAIHAAGTDTPAPLPAGRPVDDDPAALLYTSGSTGKPKGVVVSHRNLVSGAFSVAAYQGLTDDDVVLGVLPLSFDAGLSQLTTALAAGACYAPLDFLQPAEVPRHCDAFGVMSITGVPPLWMQLASAGWSDTARTRDPPLREHRRPSRDARCTACRRCSRTPRRT